MVVIGILACLGQLGELGYYFGLEPQRWGRSILDTMKNITIVEPVVTIKSALKENDIPALEELADALK